MQPNVILKNSILNQLQTNPQQFEFFQAVRLLQQKAIRFNALPSLAFPACSIEDITLDHQASAKMRVSFMGLTGPNGVLPDHYTELLIQRLQAKDTALRDFFDLFNHRTIMLFYQAWEKYRFYLEDKSAPSSMNNPHPFKQVLCSLLGIGTAHLAKRLTVPDEALFYYGGALTRQPRSASMLAGLLQGYFKLPIKINQFQGGWLRLDKNNSSHLPTRAHPAGQYIELGINTVLGQRSWDVQSKFRLVIGPLSYPQFLQLLPNSATLKSLSELTRFYAGMHLSFDIQLQLKANEVPFCSLNMNQPYRLGWNSWLKTASFKRDARDTLINPRQ